MLRERSSNIAAKNVLRQQLEAQAQQRAMTALVDKLAGQATIQQ